MVNPENKGKFNTVNCFDCGAKLEMTCLCKGCSSKRKKAGTL